MKRGNPSPLRRRAGAQAARFLLWLGRHSTPRRNRLLAKALCSLALPFLKREIRKAEETLALARLPLQVTSRSAFIRRVFENFGKAALDTATAVHHWPGILEHLLIKENLRDFQDGVRDLHDQHGRLILMTCHLGNWEIMAGILSMTVPSLAAVAKRVSYPDYQDVIEDIRKGVDLGVIYQDEPIRKMMKHLRNGGSLGLLPDQDIRRNAGLFVPFFGYPAYTPAGPAVLSITTRSPIVPVFMHHEGEGYRLTVDDPIIPPSKRNDDTIRDITLRCQRVIEKHISRHPEQWAWFHPRYRTRPEDIE